jgi:predicted outer membrane repeat protein
MSHSIEFETVSFDQVKWRRLLNPIGLAVAIGLSVLLLLSQPAGATSGTVTSCANDTQLSQLLGGGGSITFNCGGANNPATIILTSQKIITLPTSINGSGVITLSGGGVTRTFYVMSGAQLSLSNLTIYNGRTGIQNGGGIVNKGQLIVSATTFFSNSTGNLGGAIHSTGPLTITASSFVANRAGQGGGLELEGASGWISNTTFISNVANHGGGIENNQIGDGLHDLTIINSTFVSNTANTYAGALNDLHFGSLTILGSRFYQNKTLNGGSAALEVDSGDELTPTNVLIADSLFYSNTSTKDRGSLVLAAASTSVLTNVKIHDNRILTATNAECAGGGVYSGGTLSVFNSEIFSNVIVSGAGYGGGLCIYTGAALLSNVQIYSNTSPSSGGGVYSAGSLSIINTSLRDNVAVSRGGGIYSVGTLSVTGGHFMRNSASSGGGLELSTSNAWISGTGFISNFASGYAAAINNTYFNDYSSVNLVVINSEFLSNTAVSDSPAIYADGFGSLTISGSRFFNNRASNSSVGVMYVGSSDPLTPTVINISDSRFYSNTAKKKVGAIELGDATMAVLTNVQIYDNRVLDSSGCSGVGLHSAGTLSLYNSSIYRNVLTGTGSGGGVCIAGGSALLSNVQIYSNSARSFGGGLYSDGLLTMINSQVFGNVITSSGSGGGLQINSGTAVLTNIKVYGNQTGGFVPCAGLDSRASLLIVDSEIYSNTIPSGDEHGGGLCVSAGTARVINSSIHDNVSEGSAGIENDSILIMTGTHIYRNTATGGYAGGLGSYGTGLYLYDVDIYSNTVMGANGIGGGIDHEGGSTSLANLDRVRIFGNTIISGYSGGSGGGLSVFDPLTALTLTNSAVFNNSVGANGAGGGIHAGRGTLVTVIKSAVYNNAVPNGFGGGLNTGDSLGGSKFVMVNSTLANNSALRGGGLRNFVIASPVVMTNVTIYGNSASIGGNISGTAKLINTIVGGSANNCANAITSLGHNLDSGNTCGFNSIGDLKNTNPLLMPLANNGGPTWSMLPLPGSQAIDHGAACPSTDQRGIGRPFGAQCDIGAVEYDHVVYSIYLPLELKNF